jgi:uncharacterized protein (TIGR03435 family)
MRIHWAATQQRVYALVAGKNGPQLKASKNELGSTDGAGPGGAPLASGLSFSAAGHVEFLGATLQAFSDTLSAFLDRPVLDMTGIPGRFDISLDVSMEDLVGLKTLAASAMVERPSDGGAAMPDGARAESVFSAIRGLGLKLEPRNVPTKQLVVDSATKEPTEN